MTGVIPQNTIEQIRQASDIVDIIGEFVRLKKRGRNFIALCPFHVEKTPSFSVSPEKQIYYCFGCGKGGNVFSFLMEHEKMSFVEAVKFLGRKAGISVEERKESSAAKEELERLHYAHQVALDYYRSLLKSEKYRSLVMPYLKQTRRLKAETIDLFQLGVAGEEWDGFLRHALRKDLFPKDLERAGLIIKSEKGETYYDRFRRRLIIPIFDLSEKPIAFGARALKKGEAAKYINSPETPLYSKSNTLYGLNFARQFIREKNEVIIVEGYFDFISLFQAGIKNVVASSGTAFTSQQARLLARFAESAYLFFDADSAGQQAAIRSVDSLFDAGMEVFVMSPPEGEDPDSAAMKFGPDGINKIKAEAKSYLSFRLRDYDPDKSGIIAKEKIVKELAELAGKIGDFVRRRLFIEEASESLRVNPQNFYDLLPGRTIPEKGSGAPPAAKKCQDIERELLSLMIEFPDNIEAIREKIIPEDFQDPVNMKIFSLISAIYSTHGTVSESELLDFIDDPSLASEIISLAARDWSGHNIPVTIKDYVRKLADYKRERIIDGLKEKLKVAEASGDSIRAKSLMEEITDLVKRRAK
jgi:DNA primase